MQIHEIQSQIDSTEFAIYTLETLACQNHDAKQVKKIKRARGFWLAKRAHLYEQLEAKIYYGTLSPPPNSAAD